MPPFKTPIFRDGHVLVAADTELICHTEAATPAELDYIIMCVNSHAQMRDALLIARRLFDEALPQFDWGASCLNDIAITLLNQAPMAVYRAIQLDPPKET